MRLGYLVAFNPYTSRTGTEVGARHVAEGMVARGHDVTVFHAYGSSSPAVDATRARVIGTRQTRVPLVSGWEANRQMLRMVRNEASERFDVLNLFGSSLGPAFRRLQAACNMRVFHVIDLALPEWGSLRQRKLASFPFYLLLALGERQAVRAADVFVPISTGTRDDLESRYPSSRGRTHVVPLPVPDAWFEAPGASDRQHFLYIAAGVRRWTEVFLHALARLKEMGTPAKGVILREPRATMRNLASKLDVEVTFADDVPDGAPLMELYAKSYAFVLPSSREGMCIPVIEAASQGTPTISSPLPSVTGFIEPGVTGILVASRAAGAWAEQMNAVMTDDGLRTRLGSHARARSEAYRVSNVVAELESIYAKGVR